MAYTDGNGTGSRNAFDCENPACGAQIAMNNPTEFKRLTDLGYSFEDAADIRPINRKRKNSSQDGGVRKKYRCHHPGCNKFKVDCVHGKSRKEDAIQQADSLYENDTEELNLRPLVPARNDKKTTPENQVNSDRHSIANRTKRPATTTRKTKHGTPTAARCMQRMGSVKLPR